MLYCIVSDVLIRENESLPQNNSYYMFMMTICMKILLGGNLYISSDIFHGLDIESEMEKIDHPRRSWKNEGWGVEIEELSYCASKICLCFPLIP